MPFSSPTPAQPQQRSALDRARQVLLFEAGGLLLVTPPFAWLSNSPMERAFVLLAISAVIAALWNAVYNTAFDWLEGRYTGRTADKRPWWMRVFHAIGFEGGLLLMTLPLIMKVTGMGWQAALMAENGGAIPDLRLLHLRF